MLLSQRNRRFLFAGVLAASFASATQKGIAQEQGECDISSGVTSCEGLPVIAGCDDTQGNCDGYAGLTSPKSIWNRDTMTGDWGGRRTALKESGITVAGRSTHFGFGVDGGVNTPSCI